MADIKNQRDRQQLQVDKLNFELHQTRKESRHTSEKSSENEQSLKSEINFLLDRLLKTKNSLAETQEAKENLSLTLQKHQLMLSTTESYHPSVQHSQAHSPARVLLSTPN